MALRQRFGGKKKSQGRTPGAWAARNACQVGPARRWLQARGTQHAADRARRHVGTLYGIPTGIDLWAIQDVADDVVRAEVMQRPIPIDRPTATMGYAAVPASYLRHVIRAAERFGLDPRDIIVELGCRRAVVGQEDVVVQIAADMAGR